MFDYNFHHTDITNSIVISTLPPAESPPNSSHLTEMAYFRITLLRSAIGLPEKSSRVLAALGLRKRLNTVYQPVTPSTAGQVFAVKELVDVEEVETALSKQEMKALRRPEPGFYVESRIRDVRNAL